MRQNQQEAVGVGHVVAALHAQMDVMLAAPYGIGKDAVHVQRVSTKKIRAWLRLIARDLGEDVYTRENHWFRDIARRLQVLRDNETAAETFNQLMLRLPGQLEPDSALPIAKALRDGHEIHRITQENPAFGDVARAVQKARLRLVNCRPAFRPSTVLKGLMRGFRRADKLHDLSRLEPSEINLHDWRKESKYLLYQLEILAPVWPKAVAATTRKLATLCDILGDDHDLVVLETALLQAGSSLEEKSLARCRDMIRSDAERLKSAAFAEGKEIFGKHAAEFLDGFKARWRR